MIITTTNSIEGRNVTDYAALIRNDSLFLSLPVLPAPPEQAVETAQGDEELQPAL